MCVCVFYFFGFCVLGFRGFGFSVFGGFVAVVCFVVVIRLLHSAAVSCHMGAGKYLFNSIFIVYDKK